MSNVCVFFSEGCSLPRTIPGEDEDYCGEEESGGQSCFSRCTLVFQDSGMKAGRSDLCMSLLVQITR